MLNSVLKEASHRQMNLMTSIDICAKVDEKLLSELFIASICEYLIYISPNPGPFLMRRKKCTKFNASIVSDSLQLF